MPQISIITALHNKGPYVAETIRSVLAQTWPDWELIVVENGSADGGPEVVRQFRDARIRLVDSPKLGPGAGRNFGLNQATGKWILFLDADDLIEPEHLATLVGAADQHSEAEVIAGGWKEFPDGSPLELRTHRPATFGSGRSGLLASAAALAPWILHAAMVRKSALIERNRWPEELDAFPDEDTAFWFPVILDAPVAWVDHSGALYRRFAASCRSSSGDSRTRARGYSRIVEYNLAAAQQRGIELSPKCYGHISMMFEVSYRAAMAAGDEDGAEFALKSATFWLRKCPGSSWNIRVRKRLGISTVNRVKRILQGGKRLEHA